MDCSNYLIITWDEEFRRGCMELNMNEFFPCDMKTYRRLNKLIESANRPYYTKLRMKDYLKAREVKLPDEIKKATANAADLKAQKAAAKKAVTIKRKEIEKTTGNMFCKELDDLYLKYEIAEGLYEQANKYAKKISKSESLFEQYMKMLEDVEG